MTIGFDHDYSTKQLDIDTCSDYHQYQFTEILLDECQDITPLEFDCLKLFAKYNDVRRFSFAGDPLQTLNPTGFDWGRIKQLFVNTIGESKSESEKNRIAKTLRISKFHQNYRSQGDIVELANRIQAARDKALKKSDSIQMIPYEKGKQKPYLLQINSEKDKQEVEKALSNSGLGKVITICWATDDHQLIELCTSKNGDEILKNVWDRKQNESKFMDSDFRTKLIIHSSASIKGGEHDAVLLYKFGSSHNSKLESLSGDLESIVPVKQVDKIPVSYAYSRLYVVVTRAFHNVYFVEDPEGIKFWKESGLKSNEGGSLFEKVENASTINQKADFLLNSQMNRKNLRVHVKGWRQNHDRDSLFLRFVYLIT